MSQIYVGDPAKNYGPHGQQQECVYTGYGREPDGHPVGEAEKRWMRAPWYYVNSTGAFRRDVCVAGHYLRIVLREENGMWGVWLMPLDRKDGRKIDGWRPGPKAPFILAVSRREQTDASLAFFRLFQPGPAE